MIKQAATLDRICENFMKRTMDFYDIPGIAVGVYVGETSMADENNGPYMFTGAGGYRNYETKSQLEADTVFHCTSVSKLFTAAGIMKLVEKGKLDLSDRLWDVIPWMYIADKRWEDITIESMLTHTSGLTDISDYNWSEHRYDKNALKDYVLSDEVAGRKLLWDPAVGTEVSHAGKFRYSSMAYNILGLVIAEVSGMSFEAFMRNEIFEPLGMDDTTFLTYERVKGYVSEECSSVEFIKAAELTGLAIPHSKGRDRVIRIEDVYPYTRQHSPSSTLTSTAADLLKWAGGLLYRAPLQKESTLDMWMPRAEVPDTGEQMGLGWFIRQQEVSIGRNDITGSNKYTLVGHEGSDDGFRTSFWMCPELGVATVLLCNVTDAPLKKLNKKLFDMIIK